MLRSFLRLPAAERRLALSALPAVVAVRVALWLLPYRRVQQLAARGRPVRGAAGRVPARGIAEGVRRASRGVPRASCLTQALAAQLLLARAGYAARVWIGVAREGAGGLDAHAWVELDGAVLLGATPDRSYVPLLAWGGATA